MTRENEEVLYQGGLTSGDIQRGYVDQKNEILVKPVLL